MHTFILHLYGKIDNLIRKSLWIFRKKQIKSLSPIFSHFSLENVLQKSPNRIVWKGISLVSIFSSIYELFTVSKMAFFLFDIFSPFPPDF